MEIGKVQAAVQAVMGTCSPNKDGELWEYLCFRNNRLASFNGSAGSITGLKLGIDCCIHGARFAALVKDFADDLDLEVQQTEGWLEIRVDKMVAKMPTLPTFDFPDLMPQDPTPVFDGVSVAESIQRVMFCVAAGKDRQEFHAVGFRGNYVYGLDGRRLVRDRMEASAAAPFLLSRTAAEQLSKLGNPTMLWREGPRFGALYKERGLMLVSSEIAATMPFDEIDAVFAGQRREIPVPGGLAAAIHRVSALADKDESRVCLENDGILLTVSAQAEHGSARETLPAPTPERWKCWVKSQAIAACFRYFKPETMDLYDVISGNMRMLRFSNSTTQHACALMHGA